MSTQANNETNLFLEEWKECRNSIDRFDRIIFENRKYGFSLITTLLSADAFLFIKLTGLTFVAKFAVSTVMIALIYALYTIDRCYQNFLRGAVARAVKIEEDRLKDLNLTGRIGQITKSARTDTWGFRLYSWFLLICAVPPLATTSAADLSLPGSLNIVFIYFIVTICFYCLMAWRHFQSKWASDEDRGRMDNTMFQIMGRKMKSGLAWPVEKQQE